MPEIREATAPDISGVPTVGSYLDTQFAGEQKMIDPLMAAMSAREKPLDIYTNLENEAGIPQLRTTAGNISKEINRLEDTISGLPENIAGRTRESMVTEAMKNRMVAAEGQPMQENLSKLTTGLGRIQGAISEGMQGIGVKTGLAMQGQEMDLQPLQFQYSALVDRNARALTGFTADRQTSIDQIYAKWSRGNTISDMEWQKATDDARSEQDYYRKIQSAAGAAGVTDLSGSTSDMLRRLGKTVSDQQSFDNAMKKYTTYKDGSGKGTTGITIPTKTNNFNASSNGSYVLVGPTKVNTEQANRNKDLNDLYATMLGAM